ncbi:substrate-binding domain-containing protein [Chitinimonas sp. BJB300]|uniref:substrate-binding domain-containing protein n=1 Tax=Chitinimonas sp. BJB300 TaxID=1559339 RepID=UPI0013042F74|nr:substrate-binding domain-containing protein [Chitinimonas sp. BJB300]
MQVPIARLALLLVMAAVPVSAQDMVFGFAGKSLDDVNFLTAFQGFEDEAKKNGDRAINIGEKGPEHFRKQSESLATAITQNLDGIALSVTNSDWLVGEIIPAVAAKNIPVITFDSDFEPKHSRFRKSFIGPDNVEIGRDMAKLAKQFLPKGGTLSLMTGGQHVARQNPNLIDRMSGVRQELSGNSAHPKNQPLHGEGGWTETVDSPWYTNDEEKLAIKQVKMTVLNPKVDVMISVGHWPVVDEAAYRAMMTSALANLKKKPIIIVAVGAISPEKKMLMDDKLIHGYVSLNFDQMGRLSYQNLRKLANGEKIPARISQENIVVRSSQ